MATLQPDEDAETQHHAHESHADAADDWSTSRYMRIEEIGVGAYGIVYKARDTNPDTEQKNRIVAMKCLRVENTEQGMPLSTVREIALLKQLETLEHRNVVRLLDVCTRRQTVRETQLMLVFEYVDQDLDMFMKSAPDEGIPASQIKDVMYQMLNGIDFLHSMRVIHRDLKPQNVLITNSGEIKIADFGLARIYSFDMALTAVVVTLWYRAPEVLLQDSYATPVDLWSAGCIFAELYNKRPLFRGTGDVNQLKKIFEFIGRPSEAEWPPDVAMPFTSFPPQRPCSPSLYVPRMDADAISLLMKLLVFNPKQRISASAAFAESYFKDRPPPLNESPGTSQQRSHVSVASTSQRMPYAERLTNPDAQAHSSSDAHGGPPGPPGTPPVARTRHSTITPALELVTTHDPPGEPAGPRRAFGNPLPLDAKDGASGARSMSPSGGEESAFLTPPSDLASSSSGFMTSSSSRSSSTSSDVVIAPAASGSVGFAVEASLPHHPASENAEIRLHGRGDETDSPSARRSRQELASNRMSWTTDPLPDHHQGAVESQENAPLRPLPAEEAGFRTPVMRRTTVRHKESLERGTSSDSALGSAASSGGHSAQGSYSSTEGDSAGFRSEN